MKVAENSVDLLLFLTRMPTRLAECIPYLVLVCFFQSHIDLFHQPATKDRDSRRKSQTRGRCLITRLVDAGERS